MGTGPERGRHIFRLAAIALTLVAQVALAADVPSGVAQRLDSALAKARKSTKIGLVVIDTQDGSCWYQRDGDTPLKPASVMKLFVTAAALEHLGPDFTFETRVYLSDDELWVVGSGDPALGDERLAVRAGGRPTDLLNAWATAIKKQQETTLSKVVLDDHIFDDQQRHPDWDRGQWHKWYAAPVGGLNIADNCVDFSVSVRNGRVDLAMRPELPAAFVSNELRVGRKFTAVVNRPPGSDVFELRGRVVRSGVLGTASAGHASIFFGFVLREALATNGISVRDSVVRRSIDEVTLQRQRPLVTHRTPIRDVIWRCNTFSQNLFAEALVKSLSAYGLDGEATGKPGSWEAGTTVEREVLEKLGVNMAGAVLRDGSGLSHGNRVTVNQIVRLLQVMRASPHREAFEGSLARAGEPGTLRRYRDNKFKGRLKAKTGTISGVRALAGYATRADGTTLAFALLMNGSAPSDLPASVADILVD